MAAPTPQANTPLPPLTLQGAIVEGVAGVFPVIEEGVNIALGVAGQLGVAGFMFAVKKVLETNDKAEVTENWVQAGYYVNDNIVLPASTITLSGLVSNTEIRHNVLSKVVSTAGKVVGSVASFLPTLGNVGKSLYQTVDKRNQITGATKILSATYLQTINIYGAVQDLLALVSNQGQVYAFFNAIRTSRTIVSIITPHKFYPSVVITDIKVKSPQEANSYSEMDVTLQEWRSFEYTEQAIAFQPQNAAEGVKKDIAPPVNNGSAKGVKRSNDSFLFQGANALRNR